MSKLPGADAARGEGPNRHINKKKRNRNRKRFSNENDTKRFENAEVDLENGDARNGPEGPQRAPDRNRYTTRMDGRPGKSGDRQAPSTSGHFRKRDSRPPVSDRPPGRENSAGSTANSTRAASTADNRHSPERKFGQRSNTRGNRKKSRSNEEALLARSLRAPVQKVPDVAYNPVAVKEADERHNRNAQGSAKKRDDVRHDQRNNQTGSQAANQSGRAPSHKRGRLEPYAALDLGTNNCRLLIALPQERGRFRVIDGFSRIVRLGEGLGASGKLSDEAMDRALEALKICSEKMIGHNIRRHRLIATEACRQAANGEHFLERVRNETGMKLEIINRETEAYLAAEGCGALMDRKADAAVLFDIGGGSSELVLVNRRHKKKRISDQIAAWTSLPIGVVTLAERHGGKSVDKTTFANMVAEVRSYIDAFEGRDALGRLWKNGRTHLLGTSGTVTTLAGIHLGLPRYERRLVDGTWLKAGDIDTVINELIGMNYEQRAASPCIGKERADLVMAGCAILEGIRQTWPSERLRVADRGLREGILTQMMERDAAWLAPKANRRRGNRHPHARNRSNAPNNPT